MTVVWDPSESAPWEAFHRDLAGPIQQSWQYGEALRALGVRVHRAQLVRDGRVFALAQFSVRRLAGYLSLAICSRGPLWDPALEGPQRRAWYGEVKRTLATAPLRVTLCSPDQSDDQLLPGQVDGLWRVMTGYSTVLLDLQTPAEDLRAALDSKWRNRLVKAEADRSIEVFTNASLPKCLWLLDREGEQRSRRQFYGLPTNFVRTWVEVAGSPGRAFALSRADVGGQTVAAMLFLLHGSSATYHIGWSDERGRQINAHNLLLWRALAHLRDRGIRVLDLGGVNTHALPGISRFKIGTGGRVVTLAGTYF